MQLQESAALKAFYVLSVTTTPSAWKGTSALIVPGSPIQTALGLHPQIAHQRKSDLDIFDSHLPDAPYIGEIGLDGAPKFKKHWNDQLAVFDHILDACTSAGGRAMSIHSRQTTSAVLDRLEAFRNAACQSCTGFQGTSMIWIEQSL
jgi:TatD DNase family protein